MTDRPNSAEAQLQSFIARIERLEEEKAAIAEDIREVYKEAKSTGFEPAIMRQIIRERRMEEHERREREETLTVYRKALGMLSDTPLGEAALRKAAE